MRRIDLRCFFQRLLRPDPIPFFQQDDTLKIEDIGMAGCKADCLRRLFLRFPEIVNGERRESFIDCLFRFGSQQWATRNSRSGRGQSTQVNIHHSSPIPVERDFFLRARIPRRLDAYGKVAQIVSHQLCSALFGFCLSRGNRSSPEQLYDRRGVDRIA
jgi:hypothetical protein